MKKKVVIYYSLTDNTKEAAEIIAHALKADIYRIQTVKPMPKSKESQMMLGGMKATFGMKTAIETVSLNYEEYDEIIIGTPIWASKSVPAINTLLKSKIVCDKTIGVFTLSGGGDNDKCIMKLKRKLPNLKTTIALADQMNEMSSKNKVKISTFVEELQ